MRRPPKAAPKMPVRIKMPAPTPIVHDLPTLLGFLFGMVFFVPFLGAAIGAGMGGLTGSLADVGIDDDFIKQVREKVTPGTSALFALTSGATAVDRVVDELKAYDFEIISTNLPEEQEQKLREAFAQE
jgi:uncharacterized membrane protein